MENNSIAEILIDRYGFTMQHEILDLDWAVRKNTNLDQPVHPTIPFVGNQYALQEKKFLIYASAEVLTDYYDGGHTDLDDDQIAINRHRWCLDNQNSEMAYFPNVHIQPMNNGTLATAAMYLVSRLSDCTFDSARDFYEKIAFGNYGKFSLETEYQRNKRTGTGAIGRRTNIDYPTREPNLLHASHPFLRVDIEVLRPDYIIMPKSIYLRDRNFMDSIKGNAQIIGIHQINARVINTHIAPNKRIDHNYKQYSVNELDVPIQKALPWINRINPEKYAYVFGYLDTLIK